MFCQSTSPIHPGVSDSYMPFVCFAHCHKHTRFYPLKNCWKNMQTVAGMAHITFIHISSDRINPLALPHGKGAVKPPGAWKESRSWNSQALVRSFRTTDCTSPSLWPRSLPIQQVWNRECLLPPHPALGGPWSVYGVLWETDNTISPGPQPRTRGPSLPFLSKYSWSQSLFDCVTLKIFWFGFPSPS